MISNIRIGKEILTSFCTVCSIVAIIIDLPTTTAFKSYQMNEECGETIALEENGGELHLDSSKMSSNKLHNGTCRVYIATSGHYQAVMFYFTEFSVGVSDTRTNVTIRGQSRVRFPELPNDLNGNNVSLTNPVRLFEVEDSMSVSYQTTFAGRYSSNFTMKFIYLGDCKVEDMSRCENGRCVSEGVYCNKTLYACGPGPNECTEWTVGAWLVVSSTILCVLVLCFGRSWCRNRDYDTRAIWKWPNCCPIRNNRREASQNSDNISIAIPEIVQFTERLPLSANEANVVPFSPPNYEIAISNTHENLDNSFTNISSSMLTPPDTPTMTVYDDYPQPTVPPIADNLPPPTDTFRLPPPSYTEVMSDVTNYMK